jgi:transposase
MEQWSEIRRRVLLEGLSRRAACREYGLHWHTLTKLLENSEPPGYRAAQPRAKRKIGPFLEIIAEILKQDQTAPRKQRHTKQRIFDRLKGNGYTGGRTAVKEVVREWARRHREVFVPLIHNPSEAQVDFGSAEIMWDGQATKVALFVMTLLYSENSGENSGDTVLNSPSPSASSSGRALIGIGHLAAGVPPVSIIVAIIPAFHVAVPPNRRPSESRRPSLIPLHSSFITRSPSGLHPSKF